VGAGLEWGFPSEPAASRLAAQSAARPGVGFEDAPDGAEAVAPADLYAFVDGAAVGGDAHFDDAAAAAGDFGEDFGLEAEALLLDADALDDLAAEGLGAEQGWIGMDSALSWEVVLSGRVAWAVAAE